MHLFVLVLSLLFSPCIASKDVLHELAKRYPKRTEGGVHLPIYRRESPRVQRRDGQTASTGLGDYVDVAYNVLMTVGGITTPVALDTGSSDLWVISDACQSCGTDIPLYPQATFQTTGIPLNLDYGDSTHPTHASGVIGSDTVSLAGLTMPNQYFAAIDDTNTQVLMTGSAGIFGLGFPINSEIWFDLFKAHPPSSSSKRRDDGEVDQPSMKTTSPNYATRFFPNFDGLNRLSAISHLHPRQLPSTSSVLASWAPFGPLLARLTLANALAAPMFTVSLQRDTIDIGGNTGMLSIGELPAGVTNESLTWVNVRTYTPAQGGLSGPPDSPNEQYPLAWEIFVEDVFLDGKKLPQSKLATPDIGLSVLLDSGTSILSGPSDVLTAIASQLGGTQFPCSTPHTLAFQIGGKLFPVDPRDFINAASNTAASCIPNLEPTDTPKDGRLPLFSWILGSPFLRSVQATFYYGNLTYPSRDLPRIGLVSTVPADADDLLKAAVSQAANSGGNFPVTSDAPSAGTPSPTSTDPNGVPQASPTNTHTSSHNGASHSTIPIMNMWLAGLVVGFAGAAIS